MTRCLIVFCAFGVLSAFALHGSAGAEPPDPEAADLAGYVDPFIGTGPSDVEDPVPGGSMGDTFPGATVPFGAVQWSPDTTRAENDTGYSYESDRIEGFSTVHYSGAGCANNEMLRIMPTLGDADWPALFSHANETAAPGHYGVTLDNGIGVELTASTRAGFGRFTFPASRNASLVVDALHRNTPFWEIRPARVEIVDDHTIRGMAIGGGFCFTPTAYRVYFHAEFDRPFRVAGLNPFGVARVAFDTTEDPVVGMKVGLSWVREANARENLVDEIPGWDFDATRRRARADWNELLARVGVTGGTDRSKRIFYTALYHALMHPNTYSDTNGEYRGFDGRVHVAEAGRVHYANFSGWDIYRSQVQLLSVLVPERAEDMVRTLVDDSVACGGGFAKWTTFNTETAVMIGDPGAQIVANMDAFGATGDVDTATVLAIMERSAYRPRTQCGYVWLRPGLALYMQRGYTPSLPRFLAGSKIEYLWMWILGLGDVSTTLEYAMADAAIGAYAGRHGAAELAADMRRRGTNWENVFDASIGYVRPRLPNGEFASRFDPSDGYSFTEGNAAQYTWMVPQAYSALVERLGGRVVATQRLDALFEEVNAGLSKPHFYMGNEPQFTVPWAYTWTGAPWRTQEVVQRILAEAFDDTPGGLPGNDDLGATSSWLVWASIGMFPAVPGEDVLVLNTPSFESVTIDVPTRPAIEVLAPGAPAQGYVRSATIDGDVLDNAWLRFGDLESGATLAFTTGTGPSDWGADPGAEPPSLPPAG